ncbi:MAG: TM2 domain-containing protein [Lentisphaerae bacterium]|nr:TM2 domain-containing protein [Lentisphaerota bacterium]
MSQENNENVSLKQCPFCAEKINILAKKCRFCGEIIDPALMRISEMKQTDNSAMKINVISYPGMSAQVAPTVTASNVAVNSTLPKNRTTYILLGVFLGGLGIHNFYAGYFGKAIAQLLISLLTGWLILPYIAVFIWCLIEICTIDKDADGVPFC